eukprot:2237041-Lingulodinium_polyedra.AAC.1
MRAGLWWGDTELRRQARRRRAVRAPPPPIPVTLEPPREGQYPRELCKKRKHAGLAVGAGCA